MSNGKKNDKGLFLYLEGVPLTLVPLTRGRQVDVKSSMGTAKSDWRPSTDLVLVEGKVLVHGLMRLRKRHRGGDVTDWYKVVRLAGVGPAVVVQRVAGRVGGVLPW